jgi:energy-coupling factor transporter ATP-binding protein EcfA2
VKQAVEIDLLIDEDSFCDALSELLGVQIPKEERERIYKRRLQVRATPDKAVKYMKYVFKVCSVEKMLDLYGDNIVLTPYQQKTLEAVTALLGDEKFAVLSGYAGVGKTTLLRFLSGIGFTRIQFLAPTNKAAAVLNKKIKPFECITIHKWLKITPKQDGDKITWKQFDQAKLMASLAKLDLVVVDEASMLNSELLEILERFILKNMTVSTKVLFVGDNFQLPPVEETKSPVFKYPRVVMKEIVRQAKDSPIIQASMQIRQGIRDGDVNSMVDSLAKFPRVVDNDYAMFSELKKNHNFVRFVAYKNKTVDTLNKIVQARLGIKGREPIRVGDIATAYSPLFIKQDQDLLLNMGLVCTDNVMPTYFISDDFWVEKVEATTIDNPKIMFDLKGKPYSFRLSSFIGDAELDVVDYTLRHIESDVVFQTYALGNTRVLSDLANYARTQTQSHLVNGAWKMFWNLKALSELKPGYALTCHKVQGSTFDNVIVDLEDILSCSSVPTLGRLLYVAVTRAAKNVYII